ncbi:AhpD-like protein [Elsinoe ampelina]|uniref:AhpD-like protein n=1 Tax=Elsinoe ampelina TaxID=302913 RepID=A0A6A6G765_9PEZI|nr:AhpD-like protein [Elsinoe ampelina]
MAPATTDSFVAASSQLTYDDGWASIQRLSPEFFAASQHLLSVPKKKGHLTPKFQSLVLLSVSCNATHMYQPGTRIHIQNALAAGATRAEIVEVIELTCTLGIHACNIGVPILVEVMKEEGLYDSHSIAQLEKKLDPERERLKADFTQKRGYWHQFWDEFLFLDPEFFAAYLELSSVPWTKNVEGVGGQGVLSPKEKELIYCAFDTAATHLYKPGLKLHIRNVFKYGGTPEEVMEVMELATSLSLHTASQTGPVIEELTKGK